MIRENLIFFILLLLPLLSVAQIKSELSMSTSGFNGPQMSIEKIINQEITELGEIDLIEFLDLRSWDGQRVNKIIINARSNTEMGANAYISTDKFAISPIREINQKDSKLEFTFNKEIVIGDDLKGLRLILQGNSFISEITVELQEPDL